MRDYILHESLQLERFLLVPLNSEDVCTGPLKQGLANYGPLLFVFVNKVLLEGNCTHSFTYCLWVFSPYLQCQNRVAAAETGWATKSKILSMWPFTETVC